MAEPEILDISGKFIILYYTNDVTTNLKVRLQFGILPKNKHKILYFHTYAFNLKYNLEKLKLNSQFKFLKWYEYLHYYRSKKRPWLKNLKTFLF